MNSQKKKLITMHFCLENLIKMYIGKGRTGRIQIRKWS